MKNLAMFGLLVATLAAMETSSMAVMTNKGEDRSIIPSPNQMTPDDDRHPNRILYAPTEQDDPAYRAAIAAFTGGIVDYFDARVATPSLELMATYDCVHTWTNFAYLDRVAFGDNLADFVDGGGYVVLGVFVTYCLGYSLGGRIMTPGYCPVVSPNCSNHFTSASYAHDGTSYLYEGVDAFECLFRDYLATQGAGIADGHYTDGEIAHAYDPGYRVIYSNGSGAFPLGGIGDWPRLIANASTCPPIPGSGGACCLPNGSCVYTYAVYCGDWLHGVFFGCDECEWVGCPDAEACCFPDGTCQPLAEFACVEQGGQAQGPGSQCIQNPCVPVPIGKTNWGRVKALYR